jgi:hypothetical protein
MGNIRMAVSMVVPAVREHKNLIRHITAAMEKSVAAFIK